MDFDGSDGRKDLSVKHALLFAQGIRSTHLPPLSLSIVVLEKPLIEWYSILAVDETRRKYGISTYSC